MIVLLLHKARAKEVNASLSNTKTRTSNTWYSYFNADFVLLQHEPVHLDLLHYQSVTKHIKVLWLIHPYKQRWTMSNGNSLTIPKWFSHHHKAEPFRAFNFFSMKPKRKPNEIVFQTLFSFSKTYPLNHSVSENVKT